MLPGRITRQLVTGGQGSSSQVCVFSGRRQLKKKVIMLTYLHMGSSAASAPAVERKETWQGWWEGFDITWDINFEFLSLLFINGSQCTFLGQM